MEDELTFEQYLVGKKIDGVKFKQHNPDQYRRLAVDFSQMHPNSFTAQYLFLINPLRRQYTLVAGEDAQKKKKALAKPKIAAKG